MLVLKETDPDLFDGVEKKNLGRQYDLLTTFIEIGLKQGPVALDKYALWALNHVAVAGIPHFGGRFREQPIYIGQHLPPHFKEVPNLMDQFISFIQENWFDATTTQLASYGLWRLNWIHPFIEGNGRTARAVCYYLLSVKEGRILGGSTIVPERIKVNRPQYINALRAADRAWDAGKLDLREMESFLAKLLAEQYTQEKQEADAAATS